MASTRHNVPVVVLFGRTNVGKSTIFNRLSSGARSLVFDREHVTRDPIDDLVEWNDKTYKLVDTGGVPLHQPLSAIDLAVRKRIEEALAAAALIVFVCDGAEGLTSEDRQLAQIARASGVHTMLVVNKIDNMEREFAAIEEFSTFGFKDMLTISAIHGRGFATFLERISASIPAITKEITPDEPEYRVAIIGKPNVGKSSLLNLLVGENRSMVSDIAGTTREAIRSNLTIHHHLVEFADTAGIRRQQAITDPLEQLMVKTSFKVLKDADLAVLMCDASEKHITDQELKLLFFAHREHKAIVLVINKSDLITAEEKAAFLHDLEQYEHLTKKLPIIWTSCITHKNISKIRETINQVRERCKQELDVVTINSIIKKQLAKVPLTYNGEEIKIYNIRPFKSSVPSLVVHTNHPEWIRPSHLAYFENVVRKQYDLIGCPVKFIVRGNNS
jgi:GTP-binding protein